MRYDLCTPRPKKDGGVYWHKIGAMFPNDKGGFGLVFDSLPIPDDKGRVSVQAFAPRDDRQGGGQQPQQQTGGYGGGDMEDAIPFAMEWR